MIKLSLESLSSKKDEICIKDIHFPPSEHDSLKNKTTIITHRVRDDADKFDRGDYMYAEEIDENYCFEVASKKIVKSIEESPYFKELTAGQVSYLKKFDKIAVLKLTKTKYERPYKLSYIKENYPPKVYEKLKSDKCHCWRARTGIDMIHLEPDDAEQKRTGKNWELMPKYLKDASDEKSVEFFGCDNKSHEKMLVIDRLKKIMNAIHYGWRNPKTGKPFKTKEEFAGLEPEDVWRLATPEQTINAEVGNCYDTVAISIDFLKKSPVKFKTFYLFCENSKFDGTHYSEGATHTVCIYQHEYDHEWRWLECSWHPFKDNDWHSSDAKTLVTWIGTAMANSEQTNIVVNEITKYPKYGCTMTEFEAECRKGSKVVVCKPEGSTESLKSKDKKDEKDSAGVAKAKKILKDLSKFKVCNNCQKFAAAVELAYRGIHVDVTETNRPDARTFDVPVGRKSPYANWCLIKNGGFTKISSKDPLESIKDTMLKWGEGSRAIIAVTWTGSHAGHVFNLTVIDGEVYLLDGTANRFKKISESKYLRKNVDSERSTGLLRTDNGSINSQMKDDTFSDESKEFGLSEDEQKYPSVTHLLSVEGEQGKSYKIYRKGKSIGTVRCDSIGHNYGDGWCIVWNYSWR